MTKITIKRIVIYFLSAIGLSFIAYELYMFNIERTLRSRYKDSTVGAPVYYQANSFRNSLRQFPWKEFEKSGQKKDGTATDAFSTVLLKILVDMVSLEPPVPINAQCRPPALPKQSEINCSHYPTAFTNDPPKNSPRKAAHLIQFGFDVDILEIHLNELYDVVDYFFIIESTHAHYHLFSKPLIWEKVKMQPRFKKFSDKVVHMVLDDVDVVNVWGMWGMESKQELARWNKFLKWNEKTKYFGDDDLIGFGDNDEIASRKVVETMKYCTLKGSSVDVGIWFPFGNIKQAFRPDWPVPDHPFSLGDPTFHRFGDIKKMEKPSRNRGASGNYILGGMHMTHYGYLPFQLIKRMTATEYGLTDAANIRKLANSVNGDWIDLEIEFALVPYEHRLRVYALDQVKSDVKDLIFLPWFYECNRGRYPTWEGKHDPRLEY